MSHDNSAPLPSSERAVSEKERAEMLTRLFRFGLASEQWHRSTDVEDKERRRKFCEQEANAIIDRLVPSPGDKGSER